MTIPTYKYRIADITFRYVHPLHPARVDDSQTT